MNRPKISALLKIIGNIGILVSFLFLPFIFERYFAMCALLPSTRHALWCLFVIIFVLSVLIIFKSHKIPRIFPLLFFSALLVIIVEFSVRFFVNIALPDVKEDVAIYAARTYPESQVYTGHPFLQFTGRPSIALTGNKAAVNLTFFNNLGFYDKDFKYEKQNNVIRIICMGESTTMDGYPGVMEEFLNANNHTKSYSFEAMNFGMGFYTTAHAVVNFFLNIIDFSPDYLVLHHNWNDIKARSLKTGFRNDYSHALSYFHDPVIHDKYFIRASILYCFVKKRIFPRPNWWFLECAVMKEGTWRYLPAQDDFTNLYPYERNLRTIIDFSLLKGIRVVLTTQPHSSRSGVSYADQMPHVIQCNVILRKIAEDYGDKIVFLDLDNVMTGKMEDAFVDICHMKKEGIDFKAKMIGEVILADFRVQKNRPGGFMRKQR